MIFRVIRVAAALLTLFAATNSFATTHVLQPDGSGDFLTIQGALNGAAEGDTILLVTGVFDGVGAHDLDFGGKSLVLRSESGDPDSTSIDAEGAGRVIYFTGGEDSTTIVQGISLVGGALSGTDRGAGIACVGSSPKIIECVFANNMSEAEGGAVYLLDSAPILEDCLIVGNRADEGAAIALTGTDVPILRGCTLTDNYATNVGGGIYSTVADRVICERSILQDNCADVDGDELYLGPSSEAEFICGIIDTLGFAGAGTYVFDLESFHGDPLFCGDTLCADAPSTGGDYTLRSNSPALASNSLCGLRIGATGQGCDSLLTGACCFDSGVCDLLDVEVCTILGGTYSGDGVPCDPNPCAASGACCLADGTCQILIETACLGASGEYQGDATSCDPSPCLIELHADGSGDYATIQDALDAAAHDTVIELSDGTYLGSGNRGLVFNGTRVTLRSASGDPTLCVIDCEQLARGLYFRDGETRATVVEGIGIHNGRVVGAARGAGIACVLGSSPTIHDCEVRSCEADANGGGLYAQDSAPLLEDCLVSGNVAENGGGIYGNGGSAIELVGTTVAGNSANILGGGILATSGSPVSALRSIIFGNCAAVGNAVFVTGSGTGLTVECSAIDTLGVTGDGTVDYGIDNVFDDPRFCSLRPCAEAPTTSGDYGLSELSPCRIENSPCATQIGAFAVSCDTLLVGACCFDDGTCAVEGEITCANSEGLYSGDETSCDPNPCAISGACCLSNGGCVVLTEPACTGESGTYLGDGTLCDPHPCPSLAIEADGSGDFATIQDALDVADDGAVIELGNGTYTGSRNRDLRFYGKEVTLRSASGDPDSCIINSGGSGRAIYFRDGEGPATLVDGIGLTTGRLTGTARGAGIAFIGSSPTVRNCLITGNTTTAQGGGIYASNSSPTLIGCTLTRNEADFGGGIYLENGSTLIATETILFGNCADGGGAQAYLADSGSQLGFSCSNVDSLGVDGSGTVDYGTDSIHGAPVFCAPEDCAAAPTDSGVYRLHLGSPCLPENNSCGVQIGALAQGCDTLVVGACCFDDVCFQVVEETCLDDGGSFIGDGEPCDPDPCPDPGACCLDDDTCIVATQPTCDLQGGFFLGTEVECPPGGCSFNYGGALLTHATPGLVYEESTDFCDSSILGSCANGVYTVAGTDTVVFHVMGALPSGTPRVAGVTFGIDYDEAALTLVDMGSCSDFELSTEDWPSPGSGTALTWEAPLTTPFTELYWFAVAATSEDPAEFTLIEHPIHGAFFADDQIPPKQDPIVCLGSLGFNSPGAWCCQVVSTPELIGAQPNALQLHPIRPNPFRGVARIVYDLPRSGSVDVAVYSPDGRRISHLFQGRQDAGQYQLTWDRSDDAGRLVGSGVYFVRLQTESGHEVQKAILVR